LVCIDIDLENAFCTLEWRQLREDVQKAAPEMRPWVDWQRMKSQQVVLASGESVEVDRGVEQGEPFGSAEAGIAIGCSAAEAHDDMLGKLVAGGDMGSNAGTGVCDQWFIDDGQIFATPDRAETFLRLLDEKLALRGARRGVGDNKKSVARCLTSSGACGAGADTSWKTSYMSHTCQLVDQDKNAEVLHAPVGPHGDYAGIFEAACELVQRLRENIRAVDDAATELTLTRKCADIAKVLYLLRCAGDRIPASSLDKFDTTLRKELDYILRCDLTDEAWSQAQLGVRQGGLGLRSSKASALLSVVASLTESRPMVHQMCADMVRAGLAAPGVLEETFDRRLTAGMDSLVTGLAEQTKQRICDHLERVGAVARARWDGTEFDGREHEERASSPAGTAGGRRPGTALVQSMLHADPEHPHNNWSAMRAQRGLHRILDEAISTSLVETFEASGREEHVVRLQELGHHSQDHTWLWLLTQAKQETCPESEFVVGLQARLGVAVGTDARICGNCHEQVIDNDGCHPFQCARAEATRGHTQVRNIILDLALQADPVAEAEPVNLAASHPSLRPADVLCSAGGSGQLLAIDVGVTHPVAADGDVDACERYKQQKLHKYRGIIPELEAQGIEYRPLIWSSWGRAHHDSEATLRTLAGRAARRRGLVDGSGILARTRQRIGLALQVRMARMLRRCAAEEGTDEADDDEPE
jgi:hypothetical protein